MSQNSPQATKQADKQANRRSHQQVRAGGCGYGRVSPKQGPNDTYVELPAQHPAAAGAEMSVWMTQSLRRKGHDHTQVALPGQPLADWQFDSGGAKGAEARVSDVAL